MNSNPARFIPLIAALVLCGCITSTKPVGDQVAVLKPEIWNAKWRQGDGSIIKTKIKDARLGVVEIIPVKTVNGPKPDPRHPNAPNPNQPVDIFLRMLGPRMILNLGKDKDDKDYDFARIEATDDHLVAYGPDASVFINLVKQHKIPGKLGKDKNGKPDGSCVLNGFSDAQYHRLEAEGFDFRSLFDEDPSEVWVRDHGIW